MKKVYTLCVHPAGIGIIAFISFLLISWSYLTGTTQELTGTFCLSLFIPWGIVIAISAVVARAHSDEKN